MPSKSSFRQNPINVFYMLIGSTLVLAIFGLVMVFSASSIHEIDTKGNALFTALRQFMFLAAALPIGFVLSRLPLKWWERFAQFGLVAAIFLVSIVLIPGIGKEVNGNRNWINLPLIDIQPGEFAKFLLILWASLMLARKERKQKMKFNSLLLIAPGFVIVIAFIMKGNDLGTAAVIAFILAGLLFISGIELKKMGLFTAVMMVLLAIGILSKDYRRARFLVFLDPFDPDQYKNVGWQTAHSLLGLASGGLFGVGLGGSRQKWGNLPEAHTDFIFSVIGEELGLVGAVAVLILLGTLLYSIFRIGLRAEDPFSRYVCSGIGCWIGIQAVLNIGTAISVLPVVGVTLPLLSYGGSALLTTILAISFVAGVGLRDKEISLALRQRLQRR
jgi:cell division protein FtsW